MTKTHTDAWEPCYVCSKHTSLTNDDGVPVCGACADVGCEACLIGLPEVEMFGGALICRGCQQAQMESQYDEA